MRYLWGQGRAFRVKVCATGAGIAGVPVGGGEVEGDSEPVGEGDFADAPAGWELSGNGEVFVGPVFTKSRISSGVFAGVTLSMNWNDGKRSTVVL
jgi:hypothetical protein